MNLQKLIFTKNACYITGKKIKPTGIMIHSTGANNPNLKRYVGPDDGILGVNTGNNHWNQTNPDGRKVCVHAFIGKLADGTIATYQTLPWDMRGWHCAGTANDTHIGFEICEDGMTHAAYFSKVYQEAVELCAMLCNKYSLNPMADGVLICHSEGFKRGIASNHSDVMHWFPKHGKSMDTFRGDVKKAMEGVTAPAPSQPTTPIGQMYRVRKTWTDSATQEGAYTVLKNAKDEADKKNVAGYKVFDESGAVVYDPNAITTNTPAPPATTEDIIALTVKHAAEIIYANEGSYGSVNKNDNGALSIGKVQWHAGRALALMQTIVKANLVQAQNTLGMTLYNEILGAAAGAWNNRVVNDAEAKALSALLTTAEGKAAQDTLATADITAYVKKGMSYGLTDCGALIYFSDGVNQYGTNSNLWKQITETSLKTTGDVTAMWNATKAQTQNHLDRREKVYKAVLALNLNIIAPPALFTKTPEEITVDNAIADGVLTDRSHWLGVLTGNIKANPEHIKTVLDRYHART